MNEYEFAVQVTASKIPSIQIVEELNKKYSKNDFFTIKHYSPAAKYGFCFRTELTKFENIKNSTDLIELLNELNSVGAKAHNAKNNFMSIIINTCNVDNKIKKRIEYFLLKNKLLCQLIARKRNAFRFNFYEKSYFDLCNNVDTKAWEWATNYAEFKFFRSTLKFSSILATIEFIKSIFDFFTTQNIMLDDLFENYNNVYEKYVAYVFANDYSNLHQYLSERNIDLNSLINNSTDDWKGEIIREDRLYAEGESVGVEVEPGFIPDEEPVPMPEEDFPF